MFQFIKTQTEDISLIGFGDYGGSSHRRNKTSYQVIDSEFESEPYYVDDVECLHARLVIHEYTSRQLNVAANLKRYYQSVMGKFPPSTYKYAVTILRREQNTINGYYPHLNFNIYVPCILQHLKRMEFVGLLK